MRRIRKLLDTGLPLLGIVAILGAVLFIVSLRAQLAVVILGILLIEVGIWRLADPLLPSERRYNALRTEVDRFIGLVRELNRTAIQLEKEETPEARAAFNAVRSALVESTDRMAEVAGKTDFEVAVEQRDRVPS